MTLTRRRLHPVHAERPASRYSVARTTRDGDSVVTKTVTGAAADRLEREAEVLRLVGGARLVELISCEPVDGNVTLVTRDAGSHTLSDTACMSPARALRALDGACWAVAELHESGWGHGALSPDHVVVGGRGTSLLCSLASAQPTGADPSIVERDIDALCEMVRTVAGNLSSTGQSRSMRTVARALLAAVSTNPTDARSIAAAVDTVRRTNRARSGALRSRRPTRTIALCASLFALIVCGAAARWVTSAEPSATSTKSVGDQRVMADLGCTGRNHLVILRPATGVVFVAPATPAGAPSGRSVVVRRITHARKLVVDRKVPGCRQPAVQLDDGRVVLVAPDSTPQGDHS